MTSHELFRRAEFDGRFRTPRGDPIRTLPPLPDYDPDEVVPIADDPRQPLLEPYQWVVVVMAGLFGTAGIWIGVTLCQLASKIHG